MKSEELFRKLLGLEDPWVIKVIKFDHQGKRVDIFMDFPSGSKFPCPVCGIPYGVYDTEERTWRHLNIFQYPTYVHAREPRIKCNEHGKKTIDLPWARKGSGFSLHFEAMVVEMCREMPVSAVSRIVEINEDSVCRILKHYVDQARKEQDLSDISVLGIDEFSVEKHHVYVTLFYDIKNSRVIHIERGKESDVFERFITKHPFLDPSYISGVREYFPNSSIVFDHFHVIKMMNDTLDRIRRKEARENAILNNSQGNLYSPDGLFTNFQNISVFESVLHISPVFYHSEYCATESWIIYAFNSSFNCKHFSMYSIKLRGVKISSALSITLLHFS